MNRIVDQRYTYSDTNGDGVIAVSEMTFLPDAVDLGTSDPPWVITGTGQMTLRPGFTVGGTLESRLGHVVFDLREARRCIRGECRALHDPRTSLADQAAALALKDGGRINGFVQPGGFLRVREIFLEVPMGGGRLRLAAQNAFTVTRVRGGDPEAMPRSGAAPSGVIGDRQPIPRTFTIRFGFDL